MSDRLHVRMIRVTPKRGVNHFGCCRVVVKGTKGVELKLYDWVWRDEEKGWKVAWANTNVASLNLSRLAEDSRELAGKHGIQLKWA